MSGPAPLLRRFAAYTTDCSLLFGGLILAQLALLPWNPAAAAVRTGGVPDPWTLHVWVFATVTVPSWVYFASFFAGARGATPGMRLFGARVATPGAERVSRSRAGLRAAVLLIPFEAGHTVMFHLGPGSGAPDPVFYQGMAAVWALIAVYLGACLVDPMRRSVHDRVAGTLVLAAY